jgi:2'-5' RNA ligase
VSAVVAKPAESGIVVPVHAAEPLVAHWRTRWDPAADLGVPAHVTLLGPFLPPPVPAADVEALHAFFATVAPCEVTYASVGRFPGGVLYLAPSPAGFFVGLTERLAEAWPQCPPYGGAYDTVVPHLTLCDGAPPEECDAAAVEVTPALPLVARASEAWLMAQAEPGGRYGVVARFPFGG